MIGVFISKINFFFDVYKILNKEDVIFVFDGVFIGNDGIGRFFFFYFL